VYVELEGALLGPGGAVTRDADGGFTLLGVRALEACARAGVLVVPVSNRARTEVEATARVLGLSDFVFDAGFVLDGEEHAGAVPEHARARGLAREECLAVSAQAGLADVVAKEWVTADRGPGVYEAVITTLAESR
jgi:hypothetical protein